MDQPNDVLELPWLEYVEEQADAVTRFCAVSELAKQITFLQFRLGIVWIVAWIAVVLGIPVTILSGIAMATYSPKVAEASLAFPLLGTVIGIGLAIAGLRGSEIYAWYRKWWLGRSADGEPYDIKYSSAFSALIAESKQGHIQLAEILRKGTLGTLSPISQLPVRVLGNHDWLDPFLPARFQIAPPTSWFNKLASIGQSHFLVFRTAKARVREDSIPKTVGGEIVWTRYSLWNLLEHELASLFDDAPIYPRDCVMKLRVKIAGLAIRERVASLREMEALKAQGQLVSDRDIGNLKNKNMAIRHAKLRLKELEPVVETKGRLTMLEALEFARHNQVEFGKKNPAWLKNLTTGQYAPVTPHLEKLAKERGVIETRYLGK